MRHFADSTSEVPRELTPSEIVSFENEFAKAAARAKRAGFDGIEIHACHGHLIAQFLSPNTNKRADEYGGSLGNRMRFLANIIRKTRAQVGENMALGVRISGNEHIQGGLVNQDFKVIVEELQKEGIDYVHVSDGTLESFSYFLPQTDGTMLDEASVFKQVLTIPVITPSIHDPAMADRAIQDGKTDMVSLARGLLADPEWARKVSQGQASEIVKCTRCNFCMSREAVGLPARCPLNPNSGRERYMPQYWQPPAELER